MRSPARITISAEARRARFWRGWLPAVLLLVMLFVTWDDGATSLFVGAIVPLHLTACHFVLRLLSTANSPAALTVARISLLVPVLISNWA